MKKIECFIREEKLKITIDSLLVAGIPGVSVSRVESFGMQRAGPEPLLRPKVKIEIYTADEEVDTLVKTLIIAGGAGQMGGDGKIAVIDVEELVRVRTGERNREALY